MKGKKIWGDSLGEKEQVNISAVSRPAAVHKGGDGDGRRLDHNQMTDCTRGDVVCEMGETKREEKSVMIDFSHLMASLNQAQHELPNVRRLLACFQSLLSQVSFPWDDIFNQPLSPELDVPRIPEPVYTDLVNWINQEISDDTLSDFVVGAFGYISAPVLPLTCTQEGLSQYSKKSIFAVLALIMRSKPDVLSSEFPPQGKQALSLTVWMIKQASQGDLHVGLYSWVRYLLPLLNSDLQWRHLILDLVEIIFAKPGALTKLENHPVWRKQCLIPPSSFENLLRLKFPATSPTEEDKTRFVKIYGSLKRVALAGALKRKAIIQQIFTVSLRLAGEGNPVLAKEAAEMATWSLTENNDVCWRLWYEISKENRAASVVLLKTLLEKWNKHSLKLPSSSPRPNAMSEFIQCIFTISIMILADKGNTCLAREATNIAIWSLAKNFICWSLWRYMCRENPDASLVILRTLVHDFEVHSPKLSSSREGMTKIIVEIFTVSLILAGEGNRIVARKAAAIAIWALTKNIVSWRRWYYLYEENLKGSVFLLETLLQDGKYDSQKLSSRATLAISQTMEFFLMKNNEGITAGGANGNLYKEADKSCKVILGRLSPGNCRSLRGACITDMVLVLVLGSVLVLIVLTVFGWISV